MIATSGGVKENAKNEIEVWLRRGDEVTDEYLTNLEVALHQAPGWGKTFVQEIKESLV